MYWEEVKAVSYLLQQVSLFDGLQDTLLGRILNLSSHQELVQDEVGLFKVEDDVQLTHLHGQTSSCFQKNKTKTLRWK